MRELAPDLMGIPGCSAINAAHLIGQTAGFSRFSGEAAFAMHVSPVDITDRSAATNRAGARMQITANTVR